MWRTVAAIITGFVAWIVIVTILNFGLRLWLPGYVHAEPTMLFTMGMKIARLSIAALTSVAAGALVRAVAPVSSSAPWILGLLLLVMFIPEHVHLWQKFPIWYHLTFLVTLAPLVALGAQLGSRSTGNEATSVAD